MRLIDEVMVQCKVLNHIRQDDEYGGYTDTWADGASFMAAIAKDSSTEAMVAQQNGVHELFTVVFSKDFELDYHDVFRRVSDGQVFRVTSNSKDSEAPQRSTVPITKVTAEKWVLPS